MSSELMIPQSVDELTRLLAALPLVSYSDLRVCQEELPAGASGPEFLQLLERRQLLTPFQVKRVSRGETEGLILGGCKLMYQNAAGSFARVYRGCRLDNGRMIGIKVLRDRWSKDRDTVQLFRREGEIGKRLKHPHIVPIYEVGSAGQIHFITMEFVEGGNLRDFLKIRGKLAVPEALRYGLHIAQALNEALAQGVTHRDMKTTNVLMSSQGVAKLIDFGLAADDAFLNRVSSPELAQALEYSTLEKNTNAPKNDPRSDLFFLGTILYELITGTPPYPRTRDRDERKNFSRYRDIRPIQSVDPSLPWRASSIVSQLLQINPHQRYQSPGEVCEDLEAVLQELGARNADGNSVQRSPGEIQKSDPSAKVLLCVEPRPQRQDVLRDYFTKHGYRVLLLGDADRALARLKSSPPDGILFFADASGDRIAQDIRQALETTRGRDIAVAAVMDAQLIETTQADMNDPRAVLLAHPVRLRDLRLALEQVFGLLDS
jgi:serine/threonine protein kinase